VIEIKRGQGVCVAVGDGTSVWLERMSDADGQRVPRRRMGAMSGL
jgi:hypothetical protein